MKTALLNRALIFVSVFTGVVQASWNINADADLRGTLTDKNDNSVAVQALGLSVRKTFSDNQGDRFILFGLVETEENVSSVMVHELYARYKGPLGVWNLSAGRFSLPYGLITSFSSSRLLYQSAYEQSIGIDADNGLMVSGTAGSLDYGLAFTQGYGPHRKIDLSGHGLVSTRAGFTFGDAEEYMLGLSAAYGKTSHGHGTDHAVQRALAGIDGTFMLGQFLTRLEASGGWIDKMHFVSVFGMVDYALHLRLDLTAAGSYFQNEHEKQNYFFAGFTFKPDWFTLRGGYKYERYDLPKHTFSIQIYRLFSFNL